MNMKSRWIAGLWIFGSIKLFIYAEINGAPFWSKVDILLRMVQIYYEKLRFYYDRSRYIIKSQSFTMIGQDILWQVEISSWRMKILLWTVEISVLTGWDLHDGRSRFSRWQLEIFMITGQDFVINGHDLNLVVALKKLGSKKSNKVNASFIYVWFRCFSSGALLDKNLQ